MPFSLDVPAAIPKESVIVAVTIPGDPVTKARPRFFRGHAYTPKRTRAGEQVLKTYFMTSFREKPLTGDVGISVIFRCAVRQRRDTDNMLKAVLDAGNGIIWFDDSQVVEIHSRKIFDSPEPSTDVIVYAGVETRKRCKHCKEVIQARAARLREFCSKKCHIASTTKAFACHECRRVFSAPQSTRKGQRTFCSLRCLARWNGKQRTLGRGPDTWRCALCGNRTGRRNITRCLACWRRHERLRGHHWIVRPFRSGAKVSYGV